MINNAVKEMFRFHKRQATLGKPTPDGSTPGAEEGAKAITDRGGEESRESPAKSDNAALEEELKDENDQRRNLTSQMGFNED